MFSDLVTARVECAIVETAAMATLHTKFRRFSHATGASRRRKLREAPRPSKMWAYRGFRRRPAVSIHRSDLPALVGGESGSSESVFRPPSNSLRWLPNPSDSAAYGETRFRPFSSVYRCFRFCRGDGTRNGTRRRPSTCR